MNSSYPKTTNKKTEIFHPQPYSALVQVWHNCLIREFLVGAIMLPKTILHMSVSELFDSILAVKQCRGLFKRKVFGFDNIWVNGVRVASSQSIIGLTSV